MPDDEEVGDVQEPTGEPEQVEPDPVAERKALTPVQEPVRLGAVEPLDREKPE